MHNEAGQQAALARKYRTLARLRRENAATRTPRARAVLRALAAEFPGALRELDNLPLEVLDARADALEATARDPAAGAPWMRLMSGYHVLLRAALHIKAGLRGRRTLVAGEAAVLARAASDRAGLEVSPAFAERVAQPPRGRIALAVLEALSAESGLTPAALDALLFPPHPGRAAGVKPGAKR